MDRQPVQFLPVFGEYTEFETVRGNYLSRYFRVFIFSAKFPIGRNRTLFHEGRSSLELYDIDERDRDSASIRPSPPMAVVKTGRASRRRERPSGRSVV